MWLLTKIQTLQLTTPHPSFTSEDQRNRVEFVMGALLGFTFIHLILTFSTFIIANKGITLDIVLLCLQTISLFTAYLIARTPYYKRAQWLAIIGTFLCTFGIIYVIPTSHEALLAVIPIFIVGIFFPPSYVVIATLISITFITTLPFYVVGDWEGIPLTNGIIIGLAMMQVTSNFLIQNYNKRLIQRTQELADSETKLRSALAQILESDRLKIALEKERELNEMKTSLMTTISHEFRTPLTVIQMGRDILEKYEDRLKPEQRRKHLEAIGLQVQHLNQLIAQINISLDSLNKEQEFKPNYMNVERMAEMLVVQYKETTGKSHLFDVRLLGQLREVFVDKNLLELMLANLITNAIKFSESLSTIIIFIEHANEQLKIVVKDEGMGISTQDRKSVFEPLVRGSNVGAIGGTGLGLSIVRESVELHQGTTITIMLPTKSNQHSS
jgi:signal transduction histidine kinase